MTTNVSRVIVPATSLCAWAFFLPNTSEQQRVALLSVDVANGAVIGGTGGVTTGVRVARGRFAQTGGLQRADLLAGANAFAFSDLYLDTFTQDVRMQCSFPVPCVPDQGYGGLTVVVWTTGTTAGATLACTATYGESTDAVQYDYKIPGARAIDGRTPYAQGNGGRA